MPAIFTSEVIWLNEDFGCASMVQSGSILPRLPLVLYCIFIATNCYDFFICRRHGSSPLKAAKHRESRVISVTLGKYNNTLGILEIQGVPLKNGNTFVSL